MPEPKVRYTVHDLAAMPDDGNRYEIIDGELFVTPAPPLLHQSAALRLASMLLPYVDAHGLRLYTAPTDVYLSDTTQVEPDLFVFPRRADVDASTTWVAVHTLLLVVEVLSPSTADTDRGSKRQLYLRERVPEYWIVDADARTISVHTAEAPGPRALTDELRWTPIRGQDPFVLDLVEYFDAVHS